MRFKKSVSGFIFLFAFSITKGQSSLTDSLFHPDSLRHIVEILASDSLQGRLAGTAENLKAAFFIAEKFKNAGLSHLSGNNGFFQEIKPSWYNVIGAIKGKTKPEQLIIFSAHYDHVGTGSANAVRTKSLTGDVDQIYNGANDNASGVAAVISLAKYFKALDNNERTLLFIVFTGEELGLLGSENLAGFFEADSIIAMINIEMIGRRQFKSSRPFVTGYERSDLIKIMNKNFRSLGGKESEKEFFKADIIQNNFFLPGLIITPLH